VVTVVADPPRADLYAEALAREGIAIRRIGQEESLLAGLAAIMARRSVQG
jgi:2-keto-3-deoxy-galactonokinase